MVVWATWGAVVTLFLSSVGLEALVLPPKVALLGVLSMVVLRG